MVHYLSLTTLFDYLEAAPNNRCIIEGEQVLNSKHLILVGIMEEKINNEGVLCSMKIMALCLQTSALLTGKPHEICGWLERDSSTDLWRINKFECSCKAGSGGKCKHVSATLLHCTRVDLQTLERLSGTDIECYWKSQKKQIQEEYKACPLRDFKCCFKSNLQNIGQLNQAEQKQCAEFLTAKHPGSALSKHKKGRRALSAYNFKINNQPTHDMLKKILETIDCSTFLPDLKLDPGNFELRDCCRSTYSSLCEVDILNIMMTCKSGSDGWKFHRKYRLTGSRCYSIFTYNKDDWESKSAKYFYPKGFTNKFVQHGIAYEKEARECYKSKLGYTVIEIGLIICSRYPWLGFSPDGIIFHEGKPYRLLEIKCPFVGRTKDSAYFVDECDYLEITARGIRLKHNHAYYAQVQLGMGLLNLKACDFVVYSSCSKSFLNVLVPFNEDFTKTLINKITFNYFKYMLHTICDNK